MTTLDQLAALETELREWPHRDANRRDLGQWADTLAAIQTALGAERDTVDADWYEPDAGYRIARIYRNGSWLEDSPAGSRRHYWFAARAAAPEER